MDGYICGFEISPNGAARSLADPDDPPLNITPGCWCWLHFDIAAPAVETWLRANQRLAPDIVDLLLSPETRPRFAPDIDGDVLILRGVNLNAGAMAHDLVSVRMVILPGIIITLRRNTIFALQDIRQVYEAGRGPETPNAFLGDLAHGLAVRIAELVAELEDSLDGLEEEATIGIVNDTDERVRERLVALRRRIVPLRRYLMPQRQALADLVIGDGGHAISGDDPDLERAVDEMTRFTEALDALRERAGLLQEEIAADLAERMNRNTYALSVVAAVFLPLGFLTGLLGINVGGLPGSDTPWAFWAVVALCIVGAAAVFWVMKRARLL